MPIPKLPLPPVPDKLRTTPKRPGTEPTRKPLEQVKEAGISAVD